MSMSPAPLIQKPATTTPPALSEEQQDRARRTVAHYSNNAAECREFLAMCGLLPAPGTKPRRRYQPTMQNTGRCKTCNCLTFPHSQWRHIPKEQRPKGARVYGGRGQCGTCHRHVLRDAESTRTVDAGPTIEHIEALRAGGRSLRSISRDAGLHQDAAWRIVSRRRLRLRPATADAIQALPLPGDELEVAS